LTVWLKDYAIREGNLSKELELARRLVRMQPSLAAYLAMKKLAIQSNQWSELRIDTLDKLNKKSRLAC
jgi:hypothetical protein